MAKMRTTGVFLAMMLGSVLAIHQIGCQTPEQRAAMANYSQTLDAAKGEVLALQKELAKYRDEIAALKAATKAGRIPVDEALALADKAMANIASTQERLAGAMGVVDQTSKAIDGMKKAGSPWWAYAIPAGLTAAQLLGTFVPQLSFLVPIAGALKGQLAGAQTQLAATQQTLDVRTEIAGSLSRTVDALAPKACAPGEAYAKEGVGPVEPPLAQRKQELLLREMSLDEVATKADYDEIRQLAKTGQI